MAETDTIKTKIAIEGEKEYRDACKNINAGLRETASEMKLVTAQFSDNAQSTEALAAKGKVLAKQLEMQKEKVAAAEAALKKLKDSGIDPTDPAYRKMQTNLNNSKADLVATEKAIESNSKAMKGSSVEIKKTAKDWSKIGEAAKKAGAAMAKAVAALGAAAVTAATALAGMTVSAAAAADELLTQSTYTHIATDDLQKYQYALNFIDGDINTLTKSMRKQTKSMDDARAGSKRAQEAYEKLGVAYTNTDGSLRDGQTVYWEIIDALGKVENETERDALAMQLLGKSGTELNSVIEAGSEKFKALGEEAEAMGAVMSGETLNALGAFDDKVQKLKAGLGGLKNAAAMIMLPFLDDLASDGIPILAEFTKGIQNANGNITEMAGVIGNSLSNIVNLIVEKLPEFVDLGVEMITTLISGILQNAPAIAAAAVSIIKTLVNGLAKLLPMIITGAAQLIAGLAAGLGEALPTLIPTIVEVMLQVVQTLVDNIPLLIDAALQLVTGLAEGIIAAIPVLLEKLPELIRSLINGLLEAVPEIIATGMTLITSLIGALPEIISTIVAALPEIINGITSMLLGSIPVIVQTGIDLITSLVDALPEIINTIVAALPEIITSIVSMLLNSIPVIVQAGFDLITSLVDALPSIITTIVAAIPEIITGLLGALIDAIPQLISTGIQLIVSLVENVPAIIAGLIKAVPEIIKGLIDAIIGFAPKLGECGLNLIKGLWNGIKDAKEWLKSKIKGFFDGIVGGIKDFFGIHSPSTLFAGFGDNLAKGLALGFEKAAPSVGVSMQKNLNGIVGGIKITAKKTAAEFERLGNIGFKPVGMRLLKTDITAPRYRSEPSRDSAEMLALLKAYLPGAAEKRPEWIVLNTGKLVGGITESLDAEYGDLIMQTERGVI